MKNYIDIVFGIIDFLNKIINNNQKASVSIYNKILKYFNGDEKKYTKFINKFGKIIVKGVVDTTISKKRLENIRNKWIDFINSEKIVNMMKDPKLANIKESFLESDLNIKEWLNEKIDNVITR